MSGNFGPQSGPIFVDDGLRRYMRSVFGRMFAGLCITGFVAWACATSLELLIAMSGGFSVFLMLVTFGMVIYLSKRIHKISPNTAKILFLLYSALTGAFLSPLFMEYTGGSVANCFFVTATFFGGLSLLGYTTKKDLTSVGSFMFVGLVCLIITSFVNVIFLNSDSLQVGLSALTLIIFAGLTAYDVQKIKYFYSIDDPAEVSTKKAVLGALDLYLDFLNMFLALLRLLGNRR